MTGPEGEKAEKGTRDASGLLQEKAALLPRCCVSRQTRLRPRSQVKASGVRRVLPACQSSAHRKLAPELRPRARALCSGAVSESETQKQRHQAESMQHANY